MATRKLRMCTICEVTCGLVIETEGRRVVSVRGDDRDVTSHGFLCPKGVALRDLDADPDRLRQPLVRRNGVHEPTSFEEAYEEIARRLPALRAEHGDDAIALYIGNPTAHNPDLILYLQLLTQVLPTRSRFSSGSVDQHPKNLICALLYGDFWSIPVPDIDRTDYLLMLGANPMESNGSLMTAPDFRGRARALRERGGHLVVVDPRRTRTAELADRHVSIRPGTDAHLLAALANSLFERGPRPGRLAHHVTGLDAIRESLRPFTAEAVAPVCGIPAPAIAALADELSSARRPCVYGRTGTSMQRFGATATWLIEVLNVLTGSLDREGGIMFPLAPAFSNDVVGGPPAEVHRWRSRVRGLGEVMGELPVACLSEEIETPGPGQIRALICLAGNPVLSTPNGHRLAAALESLDFMVALDLYLSETSRHADVILPPPSPLEVSHYEILFSGLSVRNWARFSPPVFDKPEGQPDEWELMLRLSAILAGQGPKSDLAALDDMMVQAAVQMAIAAPGSKVEGRDAAELMQALAGRRGVERMVDLGLRTGPYGDGFGAEPEGLSLDRLLSAPHGIDLGALEPRIPGVLHTTSGKVELAPPLLLDDLARLGASLDERPGEELLLIGRRHVRSNNSWMHNLPLLARGPDRCTLLVNPDDARRLGIEEGARVRVHSRAGAIELRAELGDEVRPGVVSIPHGWGHDLPGTRLAVASLRPGANSNLLAHEEDLDPVSGTAVLNGIPVRIEPF